MVAKFNEISIFDLDEDQESYYEVELWKSGDCDSHFFRRKKDAVSFFRKTASTPSDCVKLHEAWKHGGYCQIILENQ